jgi:hypothetical protein
MKAFYVFLVVLLLACAGFGWYVHEIDSCAKMSAESKSGFTDFECHKLYFAFGVLFAIAIMLALGAGIYALVPPPAAGSDNPGKSIFEGFLKLWPPIITLVLGYYFGSSQGTQPKKELQPPAGVSTSESAKPASSPVKN